MSVSHKAITVPGAPLASPPYLLLFLNMNHSSPVLNIFCHITTTMPQASDYPNLIKQTGPLFHFQIQSTFVT